MQAYYESVHQGVAEASKLEKRLAEQALSAERFRSDMARLGGAGKDAVYAEPRAYIKNEWETHRSNYDNNKSEFARSYASLLANRFKDQRGDPLKVTERTIRESWLKGL